MTASGSGGSDIPPPPPPSPQDDQDDPLLRPASDAGWDDVPPTPPAPPTVHVASPAATAAASPSSSDPPVHQVRNQSFPAYVPAATATPATVTPAIEEPLLPATYDENELRAAVGASPLAEPGTAATTRTHGAASERRRDDDDDDDELSRLPRTRKPLVALAMVVTAGVAIAGLVLLGRANSGRYFLACEAERAVPQQGRGFPPWGTRALDGEAWRPLKITAETRCQPRETDDVLELERWYLVMILEQTSALLTAREVTRLDETEALLKQALLLTRPPEHEPEKLAKERHERHKDIERLLGDVTYHRASAKLRDAAAAISDAAKQFDSAAAQHPRHASDAPAWAAYARKLAQDLRVGPVGAAPAAAAPAASTTPAERPSAPVGIALPVEPDKGSAGEPSPATPPGTSPAAPPATPAPDAGVPTGGVLL